MAEDSDNILSQCQNELSALEEGVGKIKTEQGALFKEKNVEITPLIRECTKSQQDIKKEVTQLFEQQIKALKENFKSLEDSGDFEKIHAAYADSQTSLTEIKKKTFVQVESYTDSSNNSFDQFESEIKNSSTELQTQHQALISQSKSAIEEMLKQKDHNVSPTDASTITSTIAKAEAEYNKLGSQVREAQRNFMDIIRKKLNTLDVELREADRNNYSRCLDIVDEDYRTISKKINDADKNRKEQQREQSKAETEARIKEGRDASEQRKREEEEKQNEQQKELEERLKAGRDKALEKERKLAEEKKTREDRSSLIAAVKKEYEEKQEKLKASHAELVKREEEKLNIIIKDAEEKKAALSKQEATLAECEKEIDAIAKQHERIGESNLSDESKKRGQQLLDLVAKAYEMRDKVQEDKQSAIEEVEKNVLKAIAESDAALKEELDKIEEEEKNKIDQMPE